MLNRILVLKVLKILLTSIVMTIVLSVKLHSQVYLTEGFELGAKPDGWSQEYVSGTEPWRYRNGGHSPNDNNWAVPPYEEDITRNPPSAYEGTYNAIFFKQGDDNERTKLVTPAINLLGGANIELSFYLCQIPWYFEGSTGWDVLRVYYKVSEGSSWVLLHEYLDPVYEWELQKLTLPNPSATYYVAFEGHTRWGYGTCIDNVTIQSTGLQPMWIKEIDFQQPFSNYVPSGSHDVPVMRVDFTLYGNTDTARLSSIRFTSLNSSDTDLESEGVKLFSTSTQTFSTENPLGVATNFVSGIATFTGLDHILPPGHSYLWLAYDLKTDIAYENIIDVKVTPNSILANDTLYPSVEQSPVGNRIVYQTQYLEDFEGIHNWSLTGEFEVNTPSGAGGNPGNPDPESAFSGTKILGTDLTGLGLHPYNYEPGLSDASSYLATSPSLNFLYYKNLNLFFERYLNIEVWDSAFIQVSVDNGSSWDNIWSNKNSWISDFQWTQYKINIPDEFSRKNQLMLRYKLGPTSADDNYSGWNIDDVYITGEFISKDVGISEWIYPLSGSGHTSSDSVTVRIANYGGAVISDPVPVAYSFNGGQSWTVDYMDIDIPVGGSVTFTFPTRVDLSAPGLRSSVLAETRLPGDQYTNNDRYSTQIYIVPTYPMPYLEDFETNEGYWRASGNQVWAYGTPAKSVINSASSGTKSWITGLSKTYGDIITNKDKIIFQDDFEYEMGWTFEGEFERNTPSYACPPYYPYGGSYCIGTDLSGTGTILFNYENGITPDFAYTATSPALDVTNYSNLYVNCMSWISIQDGDSVRFEVSPDNGATWYTLWKNTEGAIFDDYYIYRDFYIPDSLSNTSLFKIRFSLFYSSLSGLTAQGWSIDDLVFSGDLVNSGEGNLSSPSYDLTGLTNPVLETQMWVDTEEDVDGATLLYSLDDGKNWTPMSNSSGYDTYWNWYTGKPVAALGMNGWSGQSNGWQTTRHLLPATLVNQDNVQLQFKFRADISDNQYDGIALDDIKIFEAPYDAGVFEIISPVTACELASDQKFTLRLKNYGIRSMQAGDSIRIGYHIDRSGEIQTAEETLYLTATFPAGGTRDFIMETPFDFSASGEYQAQVFTIEDDPFFYQETSNDTVYRLIRVNKPFVDLGPDISTVRPDTVILNAYSGVAGNTYLWQDNLTTDSVFHVLTQGTYYVTVTNDIFCVASDTVEVTELIADVGVSQLVSPLSACELGLQVPVEIVFRNFGTDTVDVGDSIIFFRDINSVILKDTLIITEKLAPGLSRNYTFSDESDFSLPGLYDMKLYTMYRDDYRTYNDTLEYELEVYGYPDIDLGNDTIVMAPSYLLTATPGYFSYLWQDGSTENTFTVDQPGYGMYRVIVNDEHQCETRDSVNVTLNVSDIELDRILSPETSCDLSESIAVSVRIKNSGNQTIASGQRIRFGYQVDEGLPVKDSILLSTDFLPGDSIDYVFAQTATVETGLWYDFTVFTGFNADVKPWNDTIMMPVGVFESPVVDLGEDYRVITGIEYVLDAGSGYFSYLWQDESTDQTYTITTPGINNCSVTVTDINGCTGYDAVQIMLAVPDVGVDEIIYPVSSCTLGANENITVAVMNMGTYDIAESEIISVSYSINGAPPVIENITLTATFENGSTIYHTFAKDEDLRIYGNYQIDAATIYASDLIPSNDTVKTSFDVLGVPVVDIGAGKDTILTYSPVTLYATPGYAEYLWQDLSTDPTFVVNNTGTGIYSVKVTDINGCSTTDSVVVVYDVPDVGITRIVEPVSSCELSVSNPVSFEIMNKGYYRIPATEMMNISYSVDGGPAVEESVYLNTTLQPGNSAILAFSTGYDFSDDGDYEVSVSVDYTSDNNLSDNTLSNTVSVFGFPEVVLEDGVDTLKTSLPYTLDAGSGFTSYLWHDNSTGRTNVATRWSLFWVMVTDENGCSARDSIYVLSPRGVDDIRMFPGEIKIYPNPVNDILTLVIGMEQMQDIKLEMINLQGIILYEKEYDQIQHIENKINVQGLTPGFYYLRVIADLVPYTFTVVVE